MTELKKIYLGKDELEALRLCDLLGKTQEDAGLSMNISRGTVQRLVTKARTKVVRAIIEKAALVFSEEESEN